MNIDWIYSLESELRKFLLQMQQDNYSYFKYSYSGDLYGNKNNCGLANTVYAVRILYATGLLNKLMDNEKDNLYKSIIKYSCADGSISDPLLTNFKLKEKVRNLGYVLKTRNLNNLLHRNIKLTRRAESRQSFAALFLLNKKPKQPYKCIPGSESEICTYLSSFDWKYPWASGSHFNHLLFFLHMNDLLFGGNRNNRNLIKYAADWINNLQSSNDGCWYSGSKVSLAQKINGAMKVINGFHSAKLYKINRVEKVIDTALSAVNDKDACSNFNIVYVLYGASKVESDYRRPEIENFLLSRLEYYKKFYWPEYGGFSFCNGRAYDVLYGKKVSQGKKEPDIHGTAMFIWGISLINNILKLGLDWKIPVN